MNNNCPLFTIAIPAFKTAYLKECLDSILNQTYTDFEIVVVNDASPQDIEGVIRQYGDDSRIRYYKNAKGFGARNVIGNWNECLKHACGDYIICMGDDDKLTPDCLKDYHELIQRYPGHELFHTRTAIIDEHSDVINILDGRPQEESVYSMIWYLWNGRRQFIGDWLFKTQPLKKRGGFFFLQYAWGADHISAFEAARNTGVINSQKIGFMYRENMMNITKSTNNTGSKVEAMMQSKAWYDRFLAEQEPQNDADEVYRKLIKDNLDWYINRRVAFDISEHMFHRPERLVTWLIKRRKYGIPAKTIIHAFALSFYKRK